MGAALTQALDTAAEPRQMLPHLQQAPVAPVSPQCQRCHSTAQGWIPSTPIPSGTVFPRPRQGLEAPHVQAENSQHKHPDQIPGLRHGQTDLFDGCITSPQHTQGCGSSRAGLCPLPRCCSRHVFVSGEFKSRHQLLYTGMWGRLDLSLRTPTCLQYKAITDVYSNTSPGGQKPTCTCTTVPFI